LGPWISDLSTRGVVSYAAVVDTDADLLLEDMTLDMKGSWCCVVGSEGRGIKRSIQSLCTKRLRIGMVDGVDSLSVPIATGIILHGLRQRATSG